MPRKSSNQPENREQYITERINVEKIIPGGYSLGTLSSSKKIFLWNALPGEIVTRAQVTKDKSGFIEATALDFEKTSEYRQAPKDDCFLATSPWQIMTYDFELEQKRAILVELLRQHKIDLPTDLEAKLTVQTDDRDFYYRNKMEYSLYYDHDDAKIHLAFHGRGSHRKIPVDRSSLERPEIWQAAQTIVDDLNRRHEDARKYQSILLRCNQTGEVSGGLFENYQPRPRFENLQDEILGHTYSYSPNGFFQINLPVYELALSEIARWVDGERVLDLYAGVGTIGLSVARVRELTLVECDKSAYRELEENCRGTLAHPVWAKSEEALEYIQPDQIVVVDPPRAGCRPEVIERVLSVCPRRVIYLSCNPATQMRDVKMLLDKYHILAVQPFNFFPRTPHLENLIVLELNHAA